MMIKTTKRDFKLFVSEFKKWIDILNLHDWRVGFFHQEIGANFAEIECDHEFHIATVYLNKSLDDVEKQDIKKTAKHEALHLFFSGLRAIALYKSKRQREFDVEIEEERLVVLLTNVFKNGI
jgi:hypothetical protein